MSKQHPIYVLIGPACAGKDAILKALRWHKDLQFPVSHTTRPPREGEVNGIDYHFVDEPTFDTIKMAESVMFGGFRYGLSVSEIETKCRLGPCVIVAEAEGASRIATYGIFVTSSATQRLARMRQRGMFDLAILARLDSDRRSVYPAFVYCDEIIVNRDGELDDAVRRVLSFIRHGHTAATTAPDETWGELHAERMKEYEPVAREVSREDHAAIEAQMIGCSTEEIDRAIDARREVKDA